MLKKWITTLFLIVSIVLSVTAYASEADGDYAVGYLQYTIKDGLATITHCDEYLTGEFSVPSELSGCPVVAIGDRAFIKSQLSKLTIPESINYIGDEAFAFSSIETYIGVENVSHIGKYAFAASPVRSIALPQTMEEIPEGLFMCATFNDYSKLFLPYSAKKIGAFAFYGIPSTMDIVLPPNITEIGDAAFALSYSLRWNDLILPEGLVSIGDGAFQDNNSLLSVSLPSTLKNCGSGVVPAFFSCDNLDSVQMAEGIQSLPNAAFLNCYKLRSVDLPNSLTALSPDEFKLAENILTGDIFNSGVNVYETNIGAHKVTQMTFDVLNKNPMLNIYASNESYGEKYAIENQISLNDKEDFLLTRPQTENDFLYRVYGKKAEITRYIGAGGDVVIPDTLGGFPTTAIGEFAFYSQEENGALSFNQNTVSIVLPETLCEIRSYAFANCEMLEKVTIKGKNVASDAGAFYYCAKLKAVEGFENVVSIDNSCFAGCKELVKLPKLSESITSIPDGFAANTGIKELTLPSHITKIGNTSFSNCESLEELNLPDTLEIISNSAFSNCKALKAVIIPDSVKTICEEVFHGCSSLKYVKIGKGLESLSEREVAGLGTFTFCPSLETVILPDNLKTLYNYEFYDGYYGRFMRRIFIERPKTLTIFANQNSYAANFAHINYINYMPLIDVVVGEKKVAFDALPIIRNGRTLVPLRAIFEALGAEVLWDDETKTVSAEREDIKISLKIGEATLYKNGEAVLLDVSADIIQDRTFVPLRAVSEAFDCEVLWDDEIKTATISY